MTWWAIIGRRGGLVLDVYPEEENSTMFNLRKDEAIAGKFKTSDEAHKCVLQTLTDRSEKRDRR